MKIFTLILFLLSHTAVYADELNKNLFEIKEIIRGEYDDYRINQSKDSKGNIIVYFAPYLLLKDHMGKEYGHYVTSVRLYSKESKKLYTIFSREIPTLFPFGYQKQKNGKILVFYNLNNTVWGNAMFRLGAPPFLMKIKKLEPNKRITEPELKK